MSFRCTWHLLCLSSSSEEFSARSLPYLITVTVVPFVELTVRNLFCSVGTLLEFKFIFYTYMSIYIFCLPQFTNQMMPSDVKTGQNKKLLMKWLAEISHDSVKVKVTLKVNNGSKSIRYVLHRIWYACFPVLHQAAISWSVVLFNSNNLL